MKAAKPLQPHFSQQVMGVHKDLRAHCTEAHYIFPGKTESHTCFYLIEKWPGLVAFAFREREVYDDGIPPPLAQRRCAAASRVGCRSAVTTSISNS